MRLQLIALLALGGHAAADPEGDHATVVARESVYQDDDHTTISTSTVAIHAKATEAVTVNAHYVADAVSSASVDVVTAATKRWTEVRNEALAGAAYGDGTTSVGASYIYSHEHDWASHTIAIDGARDVLHHNLTLGFAAAAGTNHVGRADDDTFSRRMRTLGGALRVVWVGDPANIFAASYDLALASGYQASPYRFAFVHDDAGVPIAFPEAAPDRRVRHAITLRWNHHMLRDTALRSHARAYADDWGVRSLTAGTEAVVGLAPFELAASLRGYVQHHAGFYEDVYAAPRMYMTADRELSTFQDVFAGVRGAWIGERIAVDLSVTGFAFRFPEFSRLPQRTGVIGALGVVVAL